MANVKINGTNYNNVDVVKLPKTDLSGDAIFMGASVFDGTAASFENDEISELKISLRGNSNLTKISLAQATFIPQSAFESCTSLSDISMPKVTRAGSSAFYKACAAGTTIRLPKFYEGDNNSTASNSVFRECNAKYIDLPEFCGMVAIYYFERMPNVKKIRLGGDVNRILGSTFDNCPNLTHLILGGATVPELNSTAFTNTPIANGTGFIYVPSTLVDSYKAANVWSTYAAQIRAIEDYPDEVSI